ncbi:MAG: DAK2 domain-containing protein [Dehalococcoidia bacterium]|nr:DAK2 domain-containing protein [Dehalococcoidia bacterium]
MKRHDQRTSAVQRTRNGEDPHVLTGEDLREMFAAATTWLERNAEAINAINVFPVPDGDTGTNMYLTMRSTMDEAYQTGSDDAGVVASAMAHGALMGARGNSGVILSQMLRGLADSLSGKQRFDSVDLADALEQAASSAHRAVRQPVEGTILTVLREAAQAARRRGGRLRSGLRGVLASTVAAAKEAVAKTPTLLPVLKEAGVVDAGGQGLYIMLEGALRYLRGDLAPLAPLAMQDPEQSWLNATAAVHESGSAAYGYCTEFLVQGEGLSADAALEKMVSLGDSVLVVGDDRLLRVHLHTSDPGAALSYGTSLGEVVRIKIENIRAQAEQFVQKAQAGYEPTLAPISTVAVVSGKGLEDIYRSLGVTAIVPGGRTMNPSMQQILAAIDSCPENEVIVLPNNKNVVLTAEQAAAHSKKDVRVVPTESMPQGVAALLAINLEKGLRENAAIMSEARHQVRTIEVTRAIRSAVIEGVRVRKGQAIALLDGSLVAAENSAEAAVLAALAQASASEMALATIYYGADSSAEEARSLADRVTRDHPSLQTEVVYGGQPHYKYIVSLE